MDAIVVRSIWKDDEEIIEVLEAPCHAEMTEELWGEVIVTGLARGVRRIDDRTIEIGQGIENPVRYRIIGRSFMSRTIILEKVETPNSPNEPRTESGPDGVSTVQ